MVQSHNPKHLVRVILSLILIVAFALPGGSAKAWPGSGSIALAAQPASCDETITTTAGYFISAYASTSSTNSLEASYLYPAAPNPSAPQCVVVGLAVYEIAAGGDLKSQQFFQSITGTLSFGSSTTLSVTLPLLPSGSMCAYQYDAFLGEPLYALNNGGPNYSNNNTLLTAGKVDTGTYCVVTASSPSATPSPQASPTGTPGNTVGPATGTPGATSTTASTTPPTTTPAGTGTTGTATATSTETPAASTTTPIGGIQSPTATPAATTPVPSSTPTAMTTPAPSATATSTPSGTPTATPTTPLAGLAPSTLTPTDTPAPPDSYTPQPTYTALPSYTPQPTYTPPGLSVPAATYTPRPTYTPLSTQAPGATFTARPTNTPAATRKAQPSARAGSIGRANLPHTATPRPTYTPRSTYTPRPTYTPLPTYTPFPTRASLNPVVTVITRTRYHDVTRIHTVTRYHDVNRVHAVVKTTYNVKTQVRYRYQTRIHQVTQTRTMIDHKTIIVARVRVITITRYRTRTIIIRKTVVQQVPAYHYRQNPRTGRFAAPATSPARGAAPPADARFSIGRLGISFAPLWSRDFIANGDGTFQYDIVPYYGATRFSPSAPLGAPGLTVISGHDDIDGSIFRYLDQLRRGDTVQIWRGRHTYRYTVRSVTIVSPTDVRLLNARYTTPTLALISCTPYWVDTHRVIVIAREERGGE